MTKPKDYHKIITKLAKNIAPKYLFHGFTLEDAKQQCYLLGLEGLKRYKCGKGKLENFLATHISNRMKTYKRDNFSCGYKSHKEPGKISVIQTADIDGVSEEKEEALCREHLFSFTDRVEDVIEFLRERLKPKHRDLLERYIAESKLSEEDEEELLEVCLWQLKEES